jgi:SHS2 domain-containing protein
MTIAVNNSTYLTDIQSKDTRKHCHESAFMAAIHILVCLTQVDNKSYREIAVDFEDNLELVVVWVNYMTKLNWIYKNKSDDKWVATQEGKKFIQKLLQHQYDKNDMTRYCCYSKLCS